MSKPVNVALGFISAPALQQYVKCAEFCGLSREAVLAATGISAAQLMDNAASFPCDSLLRLLDYVLPRCDNPVYGLQTSQFVQPGSYGVVGYITMTSNTLGEALFRISTYEKLVSDMGVTHVEFEPGVVLARWVCHFQDPLVRRHVIEQVLASWVAYARWIMEDGENLSPVEIRLEHEAPEDRELLQHYQHVFGCPVYFGQSMSAVVMSQEQLERPLRQPDPNLRETLEQHAQAALVRLQRRYSVVDQVRTLVRAVLREQPPRKELIAEQMGMHIRNLHRKLAEEGASYQQILDEVRLEMATALLRDPRLSVEEVAARLGYSEGYSFIRAFKRQAGMTPGRFRQGLGLPAAPGSPDE
ncbi:MAG TPA: AraC family transcriptional regulator [Moraxellaceae bacterium]|nr:AraC family transcriptional regulator [Moraxellaceae bacterium]